MIIKVNVRIYEFISSQFHFSFSLLTIVYCSNKEVYYLKTDSGNVFSNAIVVDNRVWVGSYEIIHSNVLVAARSHHQLVWHYI